MIYRGIFNIPTSAGNEENILKDFRISNVPLDSAGAVVSFMAIGMPTARSTGTGSFVNDPSECSGQTIEGVR